MIPIVRPFPKPSDVMEYSKLFNAIRPFYAASTARAIIRQVKNLQPETKNEQILAMRWVLKTFLEEMREQKWYAFIFVVCKQHISRLFQRKDIYPRHEGRQRLLTDEQETNVAQWITQKAEVHEQPTIRDILEYVEMTFQIPVTKGWFQKFLLLRNGEFIKTKSSPQEESRLLITQEECEEYLKILQNHVQNTCSELLFNIDEVGTNPWADRYSKSVIIPAAMEGTRVQHGVNRGEKTTSCLACISAGGDAIMPLMVVHRATLDDEVTKDGLRIDEDVMIRNTASAYVTTEIFKEWIEKSLITYVEAVREKLGLQNEYAVLLADNCSVHTSEDVKDILAKHKIKFVTIPPHTSHLFQALDLVTFASYKQNIKTTYTHYPKGSQADTIHKVFRAIEKSTISDLNRSAFRRAGFSIIREPHLSRIQVEVDYLRSVISEARIYTSQELLQAGKRVINHQFGFINEEHYNRYSNAPDH